MCYSALEMGTYSATLATIKSLPSLFSWINLEKGLGGGGGEKEAAKERSVGGEEDNCARCGAVGSYNTGACHISRSEDMVGQVHVQMGGATLEKVETRIQGKAQLPKQATNRQLESTFEQLALNSTKATRDQRGEDVLAGGDEEGLHNASPNAVRLGTYRGSVLVGHFVLYLCFFSFLSMHV